MELLHSATSCHMVFGSPADSTWLAETRRARRCGLAARSTASWRRSLRVYSGASRVRNEPAIREAILRVLHVMVEAGSSKAPLLRDDFVTPVRIRTTKT